MRRHIAALMTAGALATIPLASLASHRHPTKPQLILLTRHIAQQHGVRPALLVAQVHQESRFNPRARSPKGAIGIAQIMPGTARAWGVNPHNTVASLHAMAKHMHRYIHNYRQQGHDRPTAERLALAAYNAGEGRVSQYGGKVPPFQETRNYIRRILQLAGR